MRRQRQHPHLLHRRRQSRGLFVQKTFSNFLLHVYTATAHRFCYFESWNSNVQITPRIALFTGTHFTELHLIGKMRPLALGACRLAALQVRINSTAANG
jgi:hypothetical protein